MNEEERRFEELWARYSARLIGVAVAFGRELEDARDIVQEVLLGTWRRLDSVAPEDEWKYLATAVRNRARRHYRQNDRPNVPLESVREPVDERADSAERRLIIQEQIEEVQRTFAAVFSKFTRETQLVFILDQRGWPSKKIAQHLGMTDNAVRSKLKRANHQLDAAFGLEKSR